MAGEEHTPVQAGPETHERIAAQIRFNIPPDMLSRYASNFVVQRQDHEVVLSFFEVVGPVILSPATPLPTEVPAMCVARITIARSRVRELANLLQQAADAILEQEAASQETN